MKTLLLHICSLFPVPCSLLLAAVPLRWTVETSQLQPVVFDVVKGETIALEATFKSYGTPVSMTNGQTYIYWQTNGMGSAWWEDKATILPGSHSGTELAPSNVIAATFTPDMNPGGPTVNGFIGSTSTSYRAAFTLRFRHGPGEIPNVIEKPMPILDLAHTIVINEPWPTSEDFAATTTVMKAELKDYVDSQIEGGGLVTPTNVTNITKGVVTKTYVDGLKVTASGLSSTFRGTDAWIGPLQSSGRTTVNVWEIRDTEHPTGERIASKNDIERIAPQLATDSAYQAITNAANAGYVVTNDSRIVRGEWLGNHWGIKTSEAYDATRAGRLESGGKVFALPSFSQRSRPSYTDNNGSTWNDIAYSNEVAQVQSQVSDIGAHLNAEDAHFVSTNYDSQTRTPEAYVEIKMNGNWLTIWREMTRWNAFVGQEFDWDTWTGFYTFKTNVVDELAQKADRAWGAYDSDTGGYAPDNCTQISSSNILISANMGFQKTIVTGGSVWVLRCNEGVASLNVDTNGYFRVNDLEGNTQFEIVLGDKQELGADADGITVNNSTTPPTVTIPYSVEADEHPTLKICGDLSTHDWKAETDADCIANVTWSGSSGAYIATVQAKNAQNAASLFVKASYMAGGETYINNVAPVGMSSIILNGTKYYLGTATISGHTVLTLSTTPPNGGN